MATPFVHLVLPHHILDAVLAHARSELPDECCGLLAGVLDKGVAAATQHYPVRNDLASPRAYATNARDLLAVQKATRAADTDWLAVYHSHPTSAAIPSRTDLEQNTYGETVVHLIVGLTGEPPDVRGWWLREKDFEEAIVSVTNPPATIAARPWASGTS